MAIAGTTYRLAQGLLLPNCIAAYNSHDYSGPATEAAAYV